MAEQVNYEKMLYDRAAGTLRVHGILSIIFGALGSLFGILMLGLMALGTIDDYGQPDLLAGFFVSAMVLIFVILPHIYLIVSGTYLLKPIKPSVARTLVIINLVIGVFYNLVILIFAIINLTQIADYERDYKPLK